MGKSELRKIVLSPDAFLLPHLALTEMDCTCPGCLLTLTEGCRHNCPGLAPISISCVSFTPPLWGDQVTVPPKLSE